MTDIDETLQSLHKVLHDIRRKLYLLSYSALPNTQSEPN